MGDKESGFRGLGSYHKSANATLNKLRYVFCPIISVGLQGKEESRLWFSAELTTIRQQVANIYILQVVSIADNLQRMNSLYDISY
jgi:hypothetical protein